jgi:lipooligosaccharide transport system permease protein
MKNNSVPGLPSRISRIYSVWYRHFRVYTKNLFSNGFPPFLEPLIFLAGMGLGLNNYISSMDGIPYIQFLSLGLLVTTAMFTAAFECSFGTFIRLEFDKVYDGMLASPISVNDLLLGEIFWAGTKGFFFTSAVLCVMLAFGILSPGVILLAPLVGFVTGVMFAALSLYITSLVSDINQFNFYFTGVLSPMFFFSGVVFPLDKLPLFLRPVAEIFPLTHSVRLVRYLRFHASGWTFAYDLLFVAAFALFFGYIGIRNLTKKLID